MNWHLVCLGPDELSARRVSDGRVVARVAFPQRLPERIQANCVARGGGHVAVVDETTNRLAFIDLTHARVRWVEGLPPASTIERLSPHGDLALVSAPDRALFLVGPDCSPVPLGQEVTAATMTAEGLLVAESAGRSVTLRRYLIDGRALRRETPILTADVDPGAERLGDRLLGLEPWGPARFVAQWPSPPDFRSPHVLILEAGQRQARSVARTPFRADAAVVRDDALLHFGNLRPAQLLRLSLSEGATPTAVFEDARRVLALAPDGSLAVSRGESLTEDGRLVAFEYIVRDTTTRAVVSRLALPFQEAVLAWLIDS